MFEDVYFDVSIDRIPLHKRREFTKALRTMTGQEVVSNTNERYRLIFWNEAYDNFDAYSDYTDHREHWKTLEWLRNKKEAPLSMVLELKEDLGCL